MFFFADYSQTPFLRTFEPETLIGILALLVVIGIVSKLLLARYREQRRVERAKFDEELRLAREDADRATRARNLFLSTIGHEIRTPLNSVLGFSELLLADGVTEEERKEYANSIQTSGGALLELIDDILLLVSLESGGVSVQRNRCHVAELLQKLMTEVKPKFLPGVENELLIEAPFPAELLIDEEKVSSVLGNVLENAAKFTVKGKVTFRAKFVTGAASTGTLTFVVSDTGCGISKESQKHIFAPFDQDAFIRSDRQKHGGTGLGLAIGQRLVQLMSGSFQLRSEVGRGTEITIALPLTPIP